MQPEEFTQFLNYLRSVDSIDVEPGHGITISVRKTLCDRSDTLLTQLRIRETHNIDMDIFGSLFAHPSGN